MLPEVEAARQEYDQLAADYDRRWRHYVERTLRVIVEQVRFQGNERILDVACGTGELERELLLRYPDLRIAGADISLGMLRRAVAKEHAGKVAWLQADAGHLPFPDQFFDYAICANSFHYFPSPTQSLYEMYRILRPNGRFVLVDWCDDYLTCRLCSLWLRLTEPAFHETYTMRGCRSMLEEAGLEVIHADRFRVGFIWGMMSFICGRRN